MRKYKYCGIYNIKSFALGILLSINISGFSQISEAAKQKNLAADKAWSSGDQNEAVRLYLESISLSPKQMLPYQRLAFFFEAKGLTDRALSYLTNGISQNPTAALFSQRALIYFSLKNYDLAKADEENAILLNKTDPIHYANAAHFSYYLKEANPTRYFDEADKIASIPKPEIWLRRGLYFAAGPADYKNAKIWFDKIFTNGDHPSYSPNDLNLMGITCYKNKEFNNAEKLFKGSLERKEDPDVMGNLASVYADQQNWQKLLELSKNMVSKYPEHIMANAFYGVALVRTGQQNEGNRFLKKAESLQQKQQ